MAGRVRKIDGTCSGDGGISTGFLLLIVFILTVLIVIVTLVLSGIFLCFDE